MVKCHVVSCPTPPPPHTHTHPPTTRTVPPRLQDLNDQLDPRNGCSYMIYCSSVDYVEKRLPEHDTIILTDSVTLLQKADEEAQAGL